MTAYRRHHRSEVASLCSSAAPASLHGPEELFTPDELEPSLRAAGIAIVRDAHTATDS